MARYSYGPPQCDALLEPRTLRLLPAPLRAAVTEPSAFFFYSGPACPAAKRRRGRPWLGLFFLVLFSFPLFSYRRRAPGEKTKKKEPALGASELAVALRHLSTLPPALRERGRRVSDRNSDSK